MPRIGPLGLPEVLIILVVVLLIFGPKKLPELAKGLGQSVREFRKGMKEMGKEFENEAKDGAPVSASTSAAAASGPTASTADAAPVTPPSEARSEA